jgi:hypothetical protein
VPAGNAARELRFALDLPTYEAIVARRDVQELAPGTKLDPLTLSESESAGIYRAGAERTADGTLLVETWNGSGWPVRHFGYLYTSSGTMPEAAGVRERIFSHYRVRPHWLRLVD